MASALIELLRYADRHPLGTVPTYLYDAAVREHQAKGFSAADETHESIIESFREELLEELNNGTYVVHRLTEKAIADYLESGQLYPKLQDRLRSCRTSGLYGYVTLDDGSVTRRQIYDHKCNLLRLCPSEAREEQFRLVERYTPIIDKWKDRTNGQIQYCVLTWPNIEAGKLHFYKREMMREFNELRKLKLFDSVKGSLVGQEDPLAIDRKTWNLHLNVVLLVKGHFDWKAVRAAWFARTRHLFKTQEEKRPEGYRDFNVHFEDVSNNESLKNTIIELVKYPAKHISHKQLLAIKGACQHEQSEPQHEPHEIQNQKESASDPDKAPPITEWPHDLFDEWWKAGFDQPKRKEPKEGDAPNTKPPRLVSFRRTRSYGVLHSLDATKWQQLMTHREKINTLSSLDLSPDYKRKTWRQIDKADRELLKPWLIPIVLDDSSQRLPVTWCGSFKFNASTGRAESARIGFIRGDNSGFGNDENLGYINNQGRGPP